MTELQAAEMIETVFQAHWPNWSFPVEEMKTWVNVLRRYDFIQARTAINNFYITQTRQGKPPPAVLIAVLNKNARAQGQKAKSNDPVLIFEILKEGKPRGQRFFGKNMPQNEVCEKASEALRESFDNLYGGNHIVIRHWAAPPQKPMDGPPLKGEARMKAIARCKKAIGTGFSDELPF